MSKLTRFREELKKRGFDGALISSKVNQIYLSNFNFDDGFVVVTPKMAYVMTDSRYEEVAHKTLDSNPDFVIVTTIDSKHEEYIICRDSGYS